MAAHAPARIERAARLRGVYAIVNENDHMLELARAALDGGIRLMQYRAKAGIVARNVRRLRALTRASDALLVMNDDWRAALAFDCDGVHLGPGDDGFDDIAPVRAAADGLLVGVSCGTAAELRRFATDDVDYVGVGSVYSTASKTDAGDAIGVEGLRALARASPLPVAAVGGITLERLHDVRSSGAAMAAVIGAIAGAADGRRAAHDLVVRWNE